MQQFFFVVCGLLLVAGRNYKSSFHKLQKNVLLDFVPDVKMMICSLWNDNL